jgi:hypothetical protein
MTPPAPDDFRPEWLAGYADGELDPAARAAVERWLAGRPGGLADLVAQYDLSPANAAFWDRAEPPEPPAAAWAAVRRRIDAGLDAATPPVPVRRGWRAAWALAGLATAGVAAAVAWVAFGPAVPAPQSHDPGPKPVEVAAWPGAEVAPMPRALGAALAVGVLPMATDDDVILSRVPEFPAGWLPVGSHPLAGAMVLASEEDLQVEESAPGAAGPAGGPRVTTTPGDAPMIYAAKPR